MIELQALCIVVRHWKCRSLSLLDRECWAGAQVEGSKWLFAIASDCDFTGVKHLYIDDKIHIFQV